MHQVLVVLATLGARAHDILLPAMLIARRIGHGGAIEREVHEVDRRKVGHPNVPQALDEELDAPWSASPRVCQQWLGSLVVVVLGCSDLALDPCHLPALACKSLG